MTTRENKRNTSQPSRKMHRILRDIRKCNTREENSNQRPKTIQKRVKERINDNHKEKKEECYQGLFKPATFDIPNDSGNKKDEDNKDDILNQTSKTRTPQEKRSATDSKGGKSSKEKIPDTTSNKSHKKSVSFALPSNNPLRRSDRIRRTFSAFLGDNGAGRLCVIRCRKKYTVNKRDTIIPSQYLD